MGRMVRKQFCIDDELDAALAETAARLHVSQGEVVRRALRSEIERSAVDARHAAWLRSKKRLEEWAALGPVPGGRGRTWTRDDLYDDDE